jgi:hypothetical protein
VGQFETGSFGQGELTVQSKYALFKIEANAEAIEETILSEQSYSEIFQGGSESNRNVVLRYILNSNLKIKEVSILRTAATSAAKGIVPSHGNVQTQLCSEGRRKYAVVSPGIHKRIARKRGGS